MAAAADWRAAASATSDEPGLDGDNDGGCRRGGTTVGLPEYDGYCACSSDAAAVDCIT